MPQPSTPLGRESQNVIVTQVVPGLSWDIIRLSQPQHTPWQSIPGHHSYYDSTGTILGCYGLPQPQHTPWQNIPGHHSNSGSPRIILGRHSNYDSPGTLLRYQSNSEDYNGGNID